MLSRVPIVCVLFIAMLATTSAQTNADSSSIPLRKDPCVYFLAELFGTSLGWISGVVEVPVVRSHEEKYYEIGLSAGIGSIQPFNGYITGQVRWSWGTKHRIEAGIGPSFLYQQAPMADSMMTQTFQPLSDAPVNISSVVGYRWQSDTGFIFRAIVLGYFDLGQRKQLFYMWPTVSVGLAF